MSRGGDPSDNLLARAGLVTNEAGRLQKPSFGNLELPWLLGVSTEESRQARERLQKGGKPDEETRYGWFIASTESEFSGLKPLLKKDWRRALKAWKGQKGSNVHNRATLHRALFFWKDSERPDAHIRECLRLYYFLSEESPDITYYRQLQEELIEHLVKAVQVAREGGEHESASRSLKVLSQTVGQVAAGNLQQRLFGQEIEEFRIECAHVMKQLLVFQGRAETPSEELLDECEKQMEETVLPLASQLSHILVEGSKERNEVEELVAKACGVLSQSFVKAAANRSAKKWLGEGMKWEPSAVQDWASLPDEDFGDEESATVSFPEQVEQADEAPEPKGSHILGVQAGPVRVIRGETREEWLESVFLCYLPLFPLRRFAAFRNPETLEIGYYLRIPLSVMDHVRQGIAVLLLSFLLALGVVGTLKAMSGGEPVSDPGAEITQDVEQDIEGVVERLKKLAQEEAELNKLEKLSETQRVRVEEIEKERMSLIKELQELEAKRKR